MVSWKINEYYQEQWTDYGFTDEEANQWMKIGLYAGKLVREWLNVGLNKKGVGFAEFLLRKNYIPELLHDKNKLEELKEEYLNKTNDWSLRKSLRKLW